jgi:hypothetical protein
VVKLLSGDKFVGVIIAILLVADTIPRELFGTRA